MDKDELKIENNAENLNDLYLGDETVEENFKDKIKDLREKLKACEAERLEYLSGWQRAKADFVNSKREAETNQKSFVNFAESSLIKDIIPTLLSFNAAMGNKESWEKVDKNWRVGIEFIYQQLLQALEKRGLKVSVPIGETFDPAFHEAVKEDVVPSEKDDNKIISVLSPGFVLSGKVVEPAKVVVGIFKNNISNNS